MPTCAIKTMIKTMVKPMHSPFLLNADQQEQDEMEMEISAPEAEEDDEKVSVSRPEFAVLSPGSHIEIQIGNMDLARKAWKKRRRSGSPMLIPCSILNTDRRSMVVDNLVFLVRKFGTPISEQDMPERPDGYKSNHIAITLPELSRWYKSHLRASLAQHATALGYETAADLVKDVFTPQLEEDCGIKLWSVDKHSWLVAGVSKMRGQRLAAASPLLQFLQGNDDTMMHTGKTRIKTDVGPGSYALEPMSAALRVSQRTIDTGVVSTGSKHQGSFMGVDPMGDGGSPLLKVSLNVPTDIQNRKTARSAKSEMEGKAIEHDLNKLKTGDGPFIGKVSYISGRSGAAFIDIGAGRSSKGKGMARVLGMLRFDDLVGDLASAEEAEDELDLVQEALNLMEYDDDDDDDEETESGDVADGDIFSDFSVDDLFDDDTASDSAEDDDDDGEETVEDISHLVTLEDGKYTFHDPDSGETIDLGDLDGIGNQIAATSSDDEEDDFFAGLTPVERLEKLGEIMGDDDDSDQGTTAFQVGDAIEVYIQAVSKQSGRFMVTTGSSVQSMKVLKKETKTNKNLDRLLSKFDGDINNILNLVGKEGEGVVKAISQTGNWLYVQPKFQDLPVGIAQLSGDISLSSLKEGDSVLVRLDGVDESRGQLAMTVVAKN